MSLPEAARDAWPAAFAATTTYTLDAVSARQTRGRRQSFDRGSAGFRRLTGRAWTRRQTPRRTPGSPRSKGYPERMVLSTRFGYRVQGIGYRKGPTCDIR